MNVITPKPFAPEAPQPLIREIAKGADYPIDALGPLRAVVEAVQSTTQAPTAIATQSALSVASLAVQGHADVETLAGYSNVSLFCLTIAQSGERKSACDKLVMSGLRDVERDRSDNYRNEMSDWQTSLKIWTAKHDRMIKDAAGGRAKKTCEAEVDLASLGPSPEQPQSPKIIVSEPTLEGLVKLYLVGQPTLGLFSDEGGGFLGGHAMNSDNRLKTIAGLSNLWGGDALDRVRAGDGATTLYGRRLAVHLMVQHVAARPLLSDPVASGQGFLARFLITEPASTIGTRLNQTYSNATDPAIIATSSRLSHILNHPLPTREGQERELEPRALTLSTDAKALLFEYYKATELAQVQGGELEQVKSFASKSPEQAARIAGVLTLWGDLTATVVAASVMSDAIELAQFYLLEAKRLAETATVSENVEKAERLRRWLLDSWPSIATARGRDASTIIPRDVVIHGPNSLRETATVKKLMVVLAAHGWLVEMEKGTVIDGQSRQLAYRIARPE